MRVAPVPTGPGGPAPASPPATDTPVAPSGTALASLFATATSPSTATTTAPLALGGSAGAAEAPSDPTATGSDELATGPSAPRSTDVTGPIADRLRAAFGTPLAPDVVRDAGVPAALLALLGAYLAGLRWLDRGGLPMARLEEPGPHDVQLVL